MWFYSAGKLETEELVAKVGVLLSELFPNALKKLNTHISAHFLQSGLERNNAINSDRVI